MASVFPDESSAGGLVIRDDAGAPTNPPNVYNAYPPAAPFVITCPPTALPSDCSARIEPRQLNAIVSELLSFAECLDPNGTWNCDSLQNLCAAFTQWAVINNIGVLISDTPPVNPPPNTLWWESDTGYLFLWYDDGSSRQWVQVAGETIRVDQISIIGSGSEANPHSVALVDCGTY